MSREVKTNYLKYFIFFSKYESMQIHNALQQISLQLGTTTLSGFSISGLATYIQIPEIDFCFDMGECPLSAVSINHIFLSHSHGDHSRCLMRHFALRRMMGIEKEPVYYIPAPIFQNLQDLIAAEAHFEGVHKSQFKMPQLVAVDPTQDFINSQYRKDLCFKTFEVEHRVHSLGITIYKQKKKLKNEFLDKNPTELIQLRKEGHTLETLMRTPYCSFIGDCTGRSLLENIHIFMSEIAIIECTYLFENEQDHAQKRGHTHIDEIVNLFKKYPEKIQSQYIVLKHFSMKYTRSQILKNIDEKMPAEFKEKILLLI
jgi:ribonuclease Z